MKKMDFIIAISALFIAFVFLGFNQYRSGIIERNSSVLRAQITVKGELYKDIPLSEKKEEYVVETDLGKNIIIFNHMGVSITEADCHDHICVETGIISKPGEIIACLPHKVVIEIKGHVEGEIDALSR
ncbi:MAG: NusG domain II-containing protein [Anaeromicrobium sp.]|jgi:hypothetical protein|uniref:NusG domain II-containing protein n=1 Tax=Anaeromicrobium sp. TaxID=1929132 RepID=UPI0025FE05E1|nr:NusG domain II-containing protein [Anaeromicrobium sp.]MCT4592965.1 NusG domain II-containing protein [Anaeromicrobium sp.]